MASTSSRKTIPKMHREHDKDLHARARASKNGTIFFFEKELFIEEMYQC